MIILTELLQCVCVVWSLNNHNYQDSDRKSVCDTPKKSGVVCGRHRWTAAELGLDRELRSFNSDRVERPEFLTAHPFVEGLFTLCTSIKSLKRSKLCTLQFSTMSDKEFEERFNEAWNEVNIKYGFIEFKRI